MAHYLDPKSDLVFKRIFGEHKHLCISLLNSMLPFDESQRIVEIEYSPGEIVPEVDALKNSIVDVRCTDSHNRQFIVEMQMYWTESFKSRVLLNASKAYVNQLDKGRDFSLLYPVYALSFVNEPFEKAPEMQDIYYHHYKIVNIRDTEKQIKGLEFIFIELTKFKPQNRAEKKLHELWLRFLTEIRENTESVSGELLENSEISEAVKYAEVSAYTREELERYDKWRIDVMTVRSVLMDAEKKGRTEGIEIGEKKGIEIGEKKKEIEFALNLYRNGVSIEQIAKYANLPVETVKAIIETACNL